MTNEDLALLLVALGAALVIMCVAMACFLVPAWWLYHHGAAFWAGFIASLSSDIPGRVFGPAWREYRKLRRLADPLRPT